MRNIKSKLFWIILLTFINNCIVPINVYSQGANAGPDQVICTNFTQLDANNPGAGVGTWSVKAGFGRGNFININQYDTQVNDVGFGPNTYIWTLIKNGNTTTDEVVITNWSAYAGENIATCVNSAQLNAGDPDYLLSLTTTSSATGMWTTTSPGVTFEDATKFDSEVYNLNPGNNFCRWTFTQSGDGPCPGDTWSEIVINYNTASPITYNVTGDGQVCAGGVAYVNTDGSEDGVEYELMVYPGPAGTGVTQTGDGGPLQFEVSAAGDYTVEAVAGPTCSSLMNGTAAITATALTDYILSALGNDYYCAGGSGITLQLSGSNNGIDYQLYRYGLPYGASKAGTGAVLQWTNIIFGDYIVEASNGCMQPMTGTVNVLEKALPLDNLVVSDETICTNSSVDFTVSGSEFAVNYKVFLGAVSVAGPKPGNGGDINFTVTPVASGINNYSVVATNGFGCISTLTDKAVVDALPLPNAGLNISDPTICSGEQAGIVLSTSEANTSYQLREDATDNPVGASQNGPGDLTFTTPVLTANNTYNIFATKTDGSGCSIEITNKADVIVNSLPTSKTINSADYCDGPPAGTVSIIATDAGVTYRLINTVTINTVRATLSPGGDINWSNISEGNYDVEAETSDGCKVTMGNLTIVKNPIPTFTPSVTVDDNTICSGTSTLLHANANSAVGIQSYLWDNGTSLNDNTIADPTASPVNNTTYTVTVTDNNGCVASQGVLVTVNASPNVSISPVAGTFTICEGSDIALKGESNKPTQSWSWDGGVFAGVGDPINDFVYSPGSSTPVTLDVVDTDGCASQAVVNVTVNETPTANAGPDREMCDGVGTTLDGSLSSFVTSPIATYEWSNGDVGITTTVMPTSTTTYDLVVTNNVGCTDTSSVSVTFLNTPTVSVTSSKAPTHSICNGESIDLTATPAGGTGIYTQYNWMPGGLSLPTVTVSPPNAVLDAAPAAQPYTIQVTDSKGCVANGLITVTTFSQSAINIGSDGGQFCKDAGNVTLQATPVGTFGVEAFWTSTTGGFIINDNQFNAGAWTPNIYNINYEYINGWGCSNNLDATVEILDYATPNLTLSIANGPDFCDDDAGPHVVTGTITNFTPGPDVTETITGPAGSITNDANGEADFNPNAAGQGIHTINYSVTTPGCNSSTSINVNVGLPVTLNVPTDMCVGDPSQVLTATDITGEWTITFTDNTLPVPNVTTIGPIPYGDPAAVIDATEAGTYDVTYTLTDGTIFCTNSTNTSCEVFDVPVISFDIGAFDHDDLNINYCSNAAAVFLVGDQPSGIFQLDGVGTPGTFDPSVVAVGSHTITYEYTDGNGCSSLVTSNNVEINAAPAVNITNLNAGYCLSDGLTTLIGDPQDDGFGNPGTWNVPGLPDWPAGTFTDKGDGTADLIPSMIISANTYTIEYSVTAANGCSGTVSRPVDIYALPTVEFTGLPASICQNATPVVLSGNQNGGVFSGTGTTGTALQTGKDTTGFDPEGLNGNYNITYTYTDGNGCVDSDMNTVNVIDPPIKYSVNGGGNYCEDGAGLLVGLSDSEGGISYELYRNGNPTANIVAGTGFSFDFGLQILEGTYSVKATGASCSEWMTGTAVVNVDSLPDDASGIIASEVNVCPDGTTTYTFEVADIAYATTYHWTVGSAIIQSGAVTKKITVTYPMGSAAGTEAISVYGENTCGVGIASSINVEILKVPTITGAVIASSTGSFIFCEGETSITFSVLQTGFSDETEYLWETTSGTITSDSSASSVTVDFPAGSISGTIRVRGVNSCGNSNWVSQPILIDPIPNLSINPLGAGDVITCNIASQVQLNAASTEAPVNITGWLWTTANGVIVAGDEANINPFVTKYGDYQVRIEVTKNKVCYNTASISVGADTVAPVASIDPHGILDCNNISLSLQANSTAASSYQWTFTPPANIVGATNTDNPTVNEPGNYKVTVTDLSNSCTGSVSTTVTRNTDAPNISVTDPSSDTLSCNVSEAGLVGNSTIGAPAYKWTTAIADATIANDTDPLLATGDKPGVYTLTVTDPANGCTSSKDVTIIEDISAPNITAVTKSSDLDCNNPSVDLTVTTDVGTDTYLWTTVTGNILNGALTNTAEVNAAADYTIIATSATTGCTSNSVINVTQDNSVAVVTILNGPTDVITCANNGQLTLNGSIAGDGGVGTYKWTTAGGNIIMPDAAIDVVVDAAGTYTLTYNHSVTGCPSSTDIVITENKALPNISIPVAPEKTCAVTNPQIVASDAPGNPILTSYLWKGPGAATINNGTTLTPDVNMAGTYTVIATAPNTCVDSAKITVTEDIAQPDLNMEVPFDITCDSLTSTISGLSGAPVTYKWTRVSGSANIVDDISPTTTVDAVGEFMLTATSTVNGCTNSKNVVVSDDYTSPGVTIVSNPAADQLTCNVSSVQVQATLVAGVSYSWSTGVAGATFSNQTSHEPFVNKPGLYTVTVKHPVSGCEEDLNVTVNENLLAPTIDITSLTTEINCADQTIEIDASASTDADTWSWTTTTPGSISSGQGTDKIIVNNEGDFTLIATNASTGCSATSAPYVITKDVSNPFIAINSGTYEITCTSATTQLSANDLPGNPGGTTYTWVGPGGATITYPTPLEPIVNMAGDYTVTAIASNGCENKATVNVKNNTGAPTITVENANPMNVTCSTPNSTLSGSSNTSGVTYQWTRLSGVATITDDNIQIASVNGSGDFRLTVTAPNGCTNFDDVTVGSDKIPPSVNTWAVIPEITCTNPEVEIGVDPVVGGSDYSYSWATFVSGATILEGNTSSPIVDKPGTYTVTVTDNMNGCTNTHDVVVNSNDVVPIITMGGSPGQITCANTTLPLSATVTNGTNYSWYSDNGGTIVSGITTLNPTIGSEGRYYISAEHTVTGCVATDFIDITADASVPDIDNFNSAPGTLTCALQTLTLTGDATAIGNKTYLWSTTDGNISSAVDIISPTIDTKGTYTIKITNDDNGCFATRSITIEEDIEKPAINITSGGALTCDNPEIDLESGVNISTGTYSFLWTTAGAGVIKPGTENSPVATVSTVANYIVQVTDLANGCSDSDNFTTAENVLKPAFTISTPNDLTCDSLVVRLNASVSNLTDVKYSWSNNGTATILNGNTKNPTVDELGWYYLTVENNLNGCTKLDSVYLDENKTIPAVTINAPSNDITCALNTSILSASNNINYNYTWSGTPAPATPNSTTTSVSAAGTYYLEVEDKVNGCKNNYSVDVEEKITPVVSPVIDDIDKCFGDANPTFIKTTGDNIEWYNDADLNNHIFSGDSYTPGNTIAGIHKYYATATGTNGCESLPAEVVFTIHALPTAPVTFGNSKCAGANAEVISAIGQNIKWYDDADVFLISGTNYLPTDDVAAGSPYKYYATKTDANGCESEKAEVEYIVKAIPSVPLITNDNIEICIGDSDYVFEAVGNNINWYKVLGGANVHQGNVYRPVENIAGTYKYYFTQTENVCESQADSVTLVINSLPTLFTISGGGYYCENGTGSDITLDNSDLTSKYELWLNESEIKTEVNGDGNSLDFVNLLDSGKYTVWAENITTGCRQLMNNEVTIGINPLPETPGIINGKNVVCQNETGVEYSVDAVDYADIYHWTVPAGFTIVAGDNTRTITVNIDNTAADGVISVYASNSNCENGTASPDLLVGVNKAPEAAGLITGDFDLCKGESNIAYSIDAVNYANTYEWDIPNGATIVSGENSRQIVVNYSQNVAPNDFIKVKAVNTCGYGAESSQPLIIHDLPFTFAGNDQPVCDDQTILVGNTPASGTGTWTVIDGAGVPDNINNGGATVSGLARGENKFVWTIQDANSCVDSDTVSIFNNTVYIDLDYKSAEICSDAHYLKVNEPDAGAGSWAIIEGSGNISSSDNFFTNVSALKRGVNKFVWKVDNQNCISSDTVTITNNLPSEPYAGISEDICADTLLLKATEPEIGNGSWQLASGSGLFDNFEEPNTIVRNLSQGANNLRWVVSHETCTDMAEITITNNQIIVEAGPMQILCNNNTSLQALNVAGGTGNWGVIQGNAYFDNYNNPTTYVSGFSPDTNLLRWEVEFNGCTSIDTVIIINNAPTTADAGLDDEFPEGNLAGNLSTEGDGTWTIISGNAQIVDIHNSTTYVSGLSPNENIFRWTINKEGCVDSDEVTITNNTTLIPNAGPDITLCNENRKQLGATAPPGYATGEWSVLDGSVFFEDPEDNKTYAFDIAPGKSTVLWTLKVGSLKETDTLVIINNTPTVANAGIDQRLCDENTLLEGNSPGIGSGIWTKISGSGNIENPTQYNTQISGLSKGANVFQWVITNENCASEPSRVKIYNDSPTVAAAGLDYSTCEDTMVLNPNTPTYGTGSWEVLTGSANFNNNIAYNLANGANTLRWKIVNNNCVSTDDVIITSYKPTAANAGADVSICVDNYQLNGNIPRTGIGETGQWSLVSGSANILDVGVHNTLAENLGSGTNVFKWVIDNNGCTSESQIVVAYDFVAANSGVNQVICADNYVLNANNPTSGTGEWTLVGGSGTANFESPNSPNSVVTGLDRGENTLRWTVTNVGCSDVSDVIITNSNPSKAFGGIDRSICGDEVTLAATPPATDSEGVWTILGGAGDFNDATQYNSHVSNLGYGANTFRWTTKKGECTSRDEVVISNNSPVGTEAGIDQLSLCKDYTTLGANDPLNGIGVWSIVHGAAVFDDAGSHATGVSNLSADTVILRWTVQNEQCIDYDDVKIVNNTPTTANAGADKVTCDSFLIMDGNMPTHGIGEWSVQAGSGTFTNPNQNNTLVSELARGTSKLIWTITKNGCQSKDDVFITSNKPTIPEAGTSVSICENHFPLNGNQPGAYGTGQWSLISGSGTFDNSSVYNTGISDLGQGENILRWTITYQGCTLYDDVIIENNIRDVFAGDDQIIFENYTTLIGNEAEGGTGTWELEGGAATIESPNTYQTTVTNIAEGTSTFSWNINVNECMSSDKVVVKYYKRPSAAYTVDLTSGCPPFNVKYTRTSIEEYEFYWDFGDGTTDSVTQNPLHTYEEPGQYIAKLVVTGPDTVDVINETLIIAYDLPEAEFDFAPEKVYIPDQAVHFYNLSINGSKFKWIFGDGGESFEENPVYTYTEEGFYSVKLSVETENYCKDSILKEEIVEVIESGHVKLPTAFTPNLSGPTGGEYDPNDFSNDVFYPIIEGVEEVVFEIYNRWGIKVFETTKLNIGWDGYYNERIAPEGIYVYKIKVVLNNGKTVIDAGDFMLIHK